MRSEGMRGRLSLSDLEGMSNLYRRAYLLGKYYEMKRRAVTRGGRYWVFLKSGGEMLGEANFLVFVQVVVEMKRRGLQVSHKERFWPRFIDFAFAWAVKWNRRPFPYPLQLKAPQLLDEFVQQQAGQGTVVDAADVPLVVEDVEQAYRGRLGRAWPGYNQRMLQEMSGVVGFSAQTNSEH